MTQVIDIVYRVDGVPAKGTVLILWPGFTTVDGKAVAAGSLSVQPGNGGSFAAGLAPNRVHSPPESAKRSVNLPMTLCNRRGPESARSSGRFAGDLAEV